MADYECELRQFVVDNFLFGREDGCLANSDSFLQLGIIDSTGIMELVSFLEQRYQITIQDEELIPQNLDSITRLVQFVSHKIEVVDATREAPC
jgi:acyl carrier protein